MKQLNLSTISVLVSLVTRAMLILSELKYHLDKVAPVKLTEESSATEKGYYDLVSIIMRVENYFTKGYEITDLKYIVSKLNVMMKTQVDIVTMYTPDQDIFKIVKQLLSVLEEIEYSKTNSGTPNYQLVRR